MQSLANFSAVVPVHHQQSHAPGGCYSLLLKKAFLFLFFFGLKVTATQRPWSFVQDLRRDEIRGWWWWWWWHSSFHLRNGAFPLGIPWHFAANNSHYLALVLSLPHSHEWINVGPQCKTMNFHAYVTQTSSFYVMVYKCINVQNNK